MPSFAFPALFCRTVKYIRDSLFFVTGLLLLLNTPALARGSSVTPPASIPQEVRSSRFTVTVHGIRMPVMQATGSYSLLNFDVSGPTLISVTADDPHFWDSGVEVQPMRYGIRPQRHGGTITFPIPGPIKLSITRPGDHFAESKMLFLFGNAPTPPVVSGRDAGLRYYGPGVHRENIDAQDGDRIYLAPGAVIFGSINIWQVHNVRVFGTGTVIYDGPQNPHDDDGWMHKKNWHCIVMDEATNIEVDGITCVTRSRTWQVQMKDSRHIGFYNVKVIGGNPNNANQDGLDWLGGGDTIVSDCFFRASDDVFAMQGNWDGYKLELMRKPGHDVTNVTIENTVASTSISNVLRVGWPQKTFNTAHVLMRDVDVIHMGFGACEVPFALFELWADPEGHGSHRDYHFENIRMEDWYSLFQLRQPAPAIRDVHFDGVWAMDGPAMVPSVLKGDVREVQLTDATANGTDHIGVGALEGAAPPALAEAVSPAAFHYTTGALRPHDTVQFTADGQDDPATRYEWIFGDGTRGLGHAIEHRFPDAQGTLLDGSGRFRVLLHVVGKTGKDAWSSQPVVVEAAAAMAAATTAKTAGASHPYQATFDVPEDGGYTVTLLTSTGGSLMLDGRTPVSTPAPQAQVCGAPGNAVQPVRDSAVLHKGRHTLSIERDSTIENAQKPDGTPSTAPLVLWEGPGVARQVLALTP